MIESIEISKVATYPDEIQELKGLSLVNFLYGSNGSGKTTIGRIIKDVTQYPSCTLTWRGANPLQTLVYNHDFVDANFNQSSDLKGVFTLGETSVDAVEKIKVAKKEVDVLNDKIESLKNALQGPNGTGGKKNDLAILDTELKDKCWAKKIKYDPKFQGAFEGFRNSSEKFKGKVVAEMTSNQAILLSQKELEEKAQSIFGPSPIIEPVIPDIKFDQFLKYESAPILRKRVIGKDDVDISAMIKKLSNSDWVRSGKTFYDVNGNICPFCQQKTSEAFSKSLDEYFDEAFVADSKAVDDLVTNYATDALRFQQQMLSIISTSSRFLDVDKLKTEKELFDSKISLNIQRLDGKKKEASQVVELESLINVAAQITSILSSANALISAHNTMVSNIAKEKKTLTEQIWKYILDEMKDDLDVYKTKRDGLEKAISSLADQINAALFEKGQKVTYIQSLEKNATSVQPTIDAINSTLISFGFRGFSLAKASASSSYKLVRPNGLDAKATLSEGEKTFITFLYFFQLLKGSISESGMTVDRIVVFDDPVSSLDSDVLFVVSNLIRGLFDEVRSKNGYIKQIFVLTHNVYFHKEVAFNPERRGPRLKDETFWTIRKLNLNSKIEKHDTNPVKTSYDLLWGEVRRKDRSNLSIQNTLRRILENYFKILCGVNPDDIYAKFSGEDKVTCKSLFSWINDGSHYVHDDLYVSADDGTVARYLEIFKQIFDKSGHITHYRMMMGDALAEEEKEVAV